MSYYVVFGVPDQDKPIEGDEVASNKGYAAFIEWASQLGDDYPELGYLAEFGECFAGEGQDHDALAQLEQDLRKALKEKPGKPHSSVLRTATRLLHIVKQRPRGTIWLGVTDGT